MKITRWALGLGLAAAVSLWGLIEADASPFSMFVLADDLSNHVNGSAPEASEWDEEVSDEDGNSGASSSGSSNNDGTSGGSSSGGSTS
ncbi:MAG: hypothetical protein WCE62_20070, partial [Polyangiales bacterium]